MKKYIFLLNGKVYLCLMTAVQRMDLSSDKYWTLHFGTPGVVTISVSVSTGTDNGQVMSLWRMVTLNGFTVGQRKPLCDVPSIDKFVWHFRIKGSTQKGWTRRVRLCDRDSWDSFICPISRTLYCKTFWI